MKSDIKRDYETQYNPWSLYYTSQVAYSFAAGALLAMEHFNKRDSSVVPEIADIDEECTVHFPDPIFANSRADRDSTVRELWLAAKDGKTLPCAVLGPLLDPSNLDLRPVLAALGNIPMVTYYPEIDELALEDSPETATMALSAASRAKAMVRYLQNRDIQSVFHTEVQSRDTACRGHQCNWQGIRSASLHFQSAANRRTPVSQRRSLRGRL